MPVWDWIAIGLTLWIGLSVFVGFGLARVFAMSRRISVEYELTAQISEYETEYWATLPPTRATREVAREVMERRPELTMTSVRLDQVDHARDAVSALRREVESGHVSAEVMAHARTALLLLRHEADQLNGQIAMMERLVRRVNPPSRS